MIMTSWIVRMVNVEVKVGRMLMMAMIKGEDVLLVKGKDDIRDDNGEDEDEDEDLDNDTRVGASPDVWLLWILAMMRMKVRMI